MRLEEGRQDAAEQEGEHAKGDHHFEDSHALAGGGRNRGAGLHGDARTVACPVVAR